MRPVKLLIFSTLALSLTGCCLDGSSGRSSVFSRDSHSSHCQCGQKHGTVRSRETSHSPRKTRPLFPGDRWNDHRGGGDGCTACPPLPCICGGCGECGSCMLPPITGPDCSAPQPVWASDPSCNAPVWSGDPTCSGPVWSGDPTCSAPAVPQPEFVPHDPGCQAPFGMAHSVPMPSPHGPGCNCGQHGHSGPQMNYGPQMNHGPQIIHGPQPQQNYGPPPANAFPAPHHQPAPPQHHPIPQGGRPNPVPPAETPVPMPVPDNPEPAPAIPIEQTSWDVPSLPLLQ